MSISGSGQRDIAIVGVAESDEMGTVPNKSSLQHHAEAAHNALEDAGLSKNEVNGLFTAGFSTLATAIGSPGESVLCAAMPERNSSRGMLSKSGISGMASSTAFAWGSSMQGLLR